MGSISKNLFDREVFGVLNEEMHQNWQVKNEIELDGFGSINPGWVQGKDCFLAFICEKGGLTVYNTLAHRTVFLSKEGEKILKAWFFSENLYFIALARGQVQVCEILLNEFESKSGEFERKLVRSDDIEGILEIDVSANLVVVKYEKVFKAFELGGSEWNIEYKGDARYTKGFILEVNEGKVCVCKVRTKEIWTFLPNFSGIFHVDVIQSTLFAYSDVGYFTFNLDTRAYNVNLKKTLYKYFEIEDSGESIVLFDNLTAAVLVPEEILIIGCQEIFSVCDNFFRIFVLSENCVFVLKKGKYTVEVISLESPQKLIGCNENDCEIFAVGSEKISIFV